LLASAGYFFGKDWKILIEYLQIYEKVALSLAIAIIVIIVAVWLIKKYVIKKNK
jgi:membrane protein DedA with SNARE-associated domain